MHKTRFTLALGVIGALAVPACDLNVPDLNNPGLDQLEANPDAVSVGAACTGLLIGNRTNIATENGYVVQLGILGREAYNFDQADPRYIGEMIQGHLNPGSPFGGAFWAAPYANIRLANVILHALDKVPDGQLDNAAKAAIRGFVHTMQALDLLQVIVTHDTNGAVIDTDHDISQLGAIVGRDATYAAISQLLDGAMTELAAGGDSFPFLLEDGYAGFDTPKTFAKFNRAIRAREGTYIASFAAPADKPAAYQKVLDALTVSFLDDSVAAGPPNFDLGVSYTYSTKSGDATSALINPNIYAHPSLGGPGLQKNGTTPDARYTRKIGTRKAGSAQGLTSDLVFSKLYPGPTSQVPLIRNEELILLKAEALWFTGQKPQAIAELDIVRQNSGGLQALPGVPADDPTFTDDLLYERQYSLMFEWGHRWIDLRRFNRPLSLDKPDDVRNVRYPIPKPECNARPVTEPACALGSTDG
ncbi:MAG TPA: RagB/SusD family nutrient uptake outer membrane protein [Kofleriaceae bacterium]